MLIPAIRLSLATIVWIPTVIVWCLFVPLFRLMVWVGGSEQMVWCTFMVEARVRQIWRFPE